MDQKLIEILIKAKDDASATLATVGGQLDTLNNKQKDMFNTGMKGIAIVTGLGAVALAGLGAYGLYAAGSMEQASIGMKNLLGSAQLANQVFGQLAVYANSTPFTFAEVQKTAQTLLGFGYAGQQAVNVTKQLGDVAAASGGQIDGLGLVTGQIFAQGKLRAQDLYQVINDGGAGIVKIMAANAGGMQKLTDEFNKGGIPAQQYFDAVNQATSKGGFAFEGAANQANTFNGRISTLKDAFTQMAERLVGVKVSAQGLTIDPNGLFEKASNAVLALIKVLNELPAWWSTHGKEIQLGIFALAGAFTALAIAWIAVNIQAVLMGLAIAGIVIIVLAVGAAIGLLVGVVVQHWTTIRNFIGGTISAIVKSVGDGLTWLKNNWFQAIGFIIGFAATLPIKLPLYMFEALLAMANMISKINWSGVANAIGNAFAGMWNWVKNAALDAYNFMHNINWGSVLTNIGKGIGNAIIDLIQGALNGALSGIPGMPKIHLPHFAQGGWVPGSPGQPQLAVVHGGEYVLSQDMLARGGGAAPGGGSVHLSVNIGTYAGQPGELRNVAASIYRELMRIDRANGSPVLPNIGVRP